jgi:hypothetical protein
MIMSDQVIIVLIVVIAVLIVLLAYRKRLKKFMIKFLNFESTIDADDAPPPVNDAHNQAQSNRAQSKKVVITGTNIRGRKNRLDVSQKDVLIDKLKVKGEDNEVNVRQNEPKVK